MNTLIKVGLGVAGLGAVTTGSYFINDYCKTERISHQIDDAGMTLLSYYEKESEWAKRWQEYIRDGRNLWKLGNFDKDKLNTNKAPKSFKDKCYYSTNIPVENNENLASQIEKFCTKSFKLSELLGKEKGIKLIQKDDSEGWKKAWKYYFDNRKNQNPLDIMTSVYSDHLPQEYSQNCLNKANKEIRSIRNSDYLTVKVWCTKKT